MIGSTIYSENGYFDAGDTGYCAHLIDSSVKNLEKQITAAYFSGCTLDIYNSLFDRTFDSISADISVSANVDSQYEYAYPNPYPFDKNHEGYGKDLDWLMINQPDLAPFDGIERPPNPGVNYPDYPKYDTDLFGYDRATYERPY